MLKHTHTRTHTHTHTHYISHNFLDNDGTMLAKPKQAFRIFLKKLQLTFMHNNYAKEFSIDCLIPTHAYAH